MKKVLAIDMGATSIRGIVAYVEEGKIVTQEIMRCSHKIESSGNKMFWQWEKLWQAIEEAIIKVGGEVESIGIDTWGVDFGLINREGELLQTPLCYRSPSHQEGFGYAREQMPEKDIFLNTGNQVMPINSLFQLLSIKKSQPQIWERVDKVLMLPDLVQYMLTGEMLGEETIWSTSQLLNLAIRKIDKAIMNQFELDKKIFPPLVKAGHIVGNMQNSRIEKLRNYNISVVSVCGHDTASALLLTESMKNPDCLFISCGTWSLVGGVVSKPIITEGVYELAVTNEIGHDSQALFFKNLTGLHIIEKLRDIFGENGNCIAYEVITEHVLNSKIEGVIDIELDIFSKEDVDMKNAIDEYLIETGQSLPQNLMDYFGIVYKSLANKYLETKLTIEKITKRQFKQVHMIGGGAKSAYLCQLVADTLETDVIAGPYEATALGNILVQLKALGEIESIDSGAEKIRKSQTIQHYKCKK